MVSNRHRDAAHLRLVLAQVQGVVLLLHVSQQRAQSLAIDDGACGRRFEGPFENCLGLLRIECQQDSTEGCAVSKRRASNARAHQAYGVQAFELLEIDDVPSVECGQMNRLPGPVAKLIYQRRRFDSYIELTQGDTREANHRQSEPVCVALAIRLQVSAGDEVCHESVRRTWCQSC